ncbi:hypothetical protein Q3V23_36020 [Streptomyces sp. VNUA116]|uniref:hypothetical protein n=1 Tax=Streptomyces sp. VNUA116 TaxID=3062449 RepID=UPI0026766E0B|nr:hypothetical protein [Streptomyces sp. VNUA116]WKU49041.1 hypothetical protein Q3V23_36020 [Streptomyces sp. VNUA116]
MTPRRPAGTGTCVLTYDVVSRPSPIQVSQGSTPSKATLWITVTNHQQSAVHVESVRFTFPVGTGPGDLSNNPGSADPQQDDDDNKKWRFELDEDNPGSAVLTPKRSATLPPGGQLDLGLAHIEINAAVGTSKLTVEERLKDTPDPGTGEWPLAKVPAGFTTGDFRPETILVGSGTPAELTWRGDSRPGATYTMLHDGEPCDVTEVRYWKSPPLHRDTAFTLVVEVTEGEDTAEYAMSTMVTVARPDLVVNDLTVTGHTVLTRISSAFDLGEATALTYTAETDGFLVGHVRADQEVPDTEDPPPTLTVTVAPSGRTGHVTSIQSRLPERAPGDPGSRLTAVVLKGSTVTVARAGTTPSTHTLTWLPFGTGELREATGG